MTFEPAGRPLRSALFVDFDNVFIGLRDASPRAAEVFSRTPEVWLEWLAGVGSAEGGYGGEGGGEASGEGSGVGGAARGGPPRPRRNLLTRNCYLNPVNDFKGYRAFFTRAGFRVVDCPSLTQQGKSSADIHMVMDVLDILAHPVRYDEVIVMSADADFTGVMLRLRSHDRRTISVSSSPVAHAYRAACDLVIGDEEFTTQLLRLQRPTAAAGTAAPTVESQQDCDLLGGMAEIVVDCVRNSLGAVSHAAIAQKFIKQYGREATVERQWFGYGSFGDVLRALDLRFDGRPLTVDFDTPGYVFDLARHARPEPPADTLAEVDAELAAFITNVNSTTNYPRLAPAAYQVLFQQIVAEIRDIEQTGRDFVLARAATAIAQRCAEAGVSVTTRQAGFILHGYELSGLWRNGPHAESAGVLAQATFESSRDRCIQMGIPGTDENEALLRRWLLAG